MAVRARALAILVLAAACAGESGPAERSDAPLPATVAADSPGGGPGAQSVPQQPSTTAQQEDGPGAAPPADEGAAAVGSGTWTAGRTAARRTASRVATLRAVRAARHDGFDRIVLDFGGDPVPAYTIEYIDRPVRQCGSGDVMQLPGDGWLNIRFEPARAHTDEGRATIASRRQAVELPNLRMLAIACDFEAHLDWVAAVASPNPYRVLELTDPHRLVVDVRH